MAAPRTRPNSPNARLHSLPLGSSCRGDQWGARKVQERLRIQVPHHPRHCSGELRSCSVPRVCTGGDAACAPPIRKGSLSLLCASQSPPLPAQGLEGLPVDWSSRSSLLSMGCPCSAVASRHPCQFCSWHYETSPPAGARAAGSRSPFPFPLPWAVPGQLDSK